MLFYQQWLHSANNFIRRFFVSGGTVANITALWVARNKLLKAEGDFSGVTRTGLYRALQYYGYNDLVILVSERGHYSLQKSADILGIGQDSVIAIPTDEYNKIDCIKLAQKCRELTEKNIKILSIIGIAGTTETGNIDPLHKISRHSRSISMSFSC